MAWAYAQARLSSACPKTALLSLDWLPQSWPSLGVRPHSGTCTRSHGVPWTRIHCHHHLVPYVPPGWDTGSRPVTQNCPGRCAMLQFVELGLLDAPACIAQLLSYVI